MKPIIGQSVACSFALPVISMVNTPDVTPDELTFAFDTFLRNYCGLAGWQWGSKANVDAEVSIDSVVIGNSVKREFLLSQCRSWTME